MDSLVNYGQGKGPSHKGRSRKPDNSSSCSTQTPDSPLHIPEPLSTTRAAISSSSDMFTIGFAVNVCNQKVCLVYRDAVVAATKTVDRLATVIMVFQMNDLLVASRPSTRLTFFSAIHRQNSPAGNTHQNPGCEMVNLNFHVDPTTEFVNARRRYCKDHTKMP